MDEGLKILLLEDVAAEARLVERSMRSEDLSIILVRVDSRDEFVKALRDFQPDVVLSDHALPQFNSTEALRLCREFSETLPFILVTGTVSEEFAVTSLKQGADDYVLKSNLSRLPRAIRHALRQREAEEKKKNAENELRVQNEELMRSNEMLRKTNGELDNFVYSVSHNLRAPLSSVLGIVNVARMEDGTNDKFYFEKIEESIQRLDRTIKDILDYSRNERTEIILDEVNLKELFFQQVEKLKYLPGFDEIKITFDLHGGELCRVDKYRVGLIFTNLLANSIKYADPAKPEKYIRVETHVTDTLKITIQDNGLGIEKENFGKIFNMFFRGSEKSDGAGLGLYITRETVQKLNGDISVESEARTGTTFYISIPLPVDSQSLQQLTPSMNGK
jgi:signal transduction histidine kinase